MKGTKIALGTWAWGAGMFGGDSVFGSNTDENNLKPVFDAAMEVGLNRWDTARLFGEEIPLREYGERIVRLAQIEVFPGKLEEYMAYAKEVGTVSMATEPGVIGLFSMQDKEDPYRIYILEVYADQQAYQSHLKTAHFKKYKEGTADMVKSLKLTDTNPMVTAKLDKTAIK